MSLKSVMEKMDQAEIGKAIRVTIDNETAEARNNLRKAMSDVDMISYSAHNNRELIEQATVRTARVAAAAAELSRRLDLLDELNKDEKAAE